MQGYSQGGPIEAALSDVPAPEVLVRLLPYLDMSVMVVQRDWTVSADLGPPGGVLGRGNAAGGHPFRSMHPDDVERIAGHAQRAMESEPGWRGSFEVRAQRGDGSYGLFDVELHNRLDDPVLHGIVVVSRPLPDPQPADAPSLPAEVAATVQLGAGDHLPIGLLLLDAEGDVVFVNQTAADLLGTDRDTLLDGFVPEGFAAVDREEILAILHRLRAAPGRESFTAALLGDSPRLLSATFVSRAGEGTGDRVQFVVVTLEDVTHRLAHERNLEHRANHDSLTGLPNRSWLLDHLHERLAAASTVLVAFVDLDGFKGVNDRGGHAAGDHLLAEVAGALASGLGPGEAVARVGGDEFVVVAGTDPLPPDGPDLAADALRRRIRAAVLGVPGAAREAVGVSIGITRSRPGDQPWDLLGRADAAMYAHKRRQE
jgi:diguanylate cyclase (GGDEF)-like protein